MRQITLPYLDPALPLTTRQDALRINYGFQCNCALCTYQTSISPLPPLPQNTQSVSALELQLCDFVTRNVVSLDPQRNITVTDINTARFSLPKELHTLLNPDYLPSLSEEFSRTSHEGEASKALSHGRILLALYAVIYPSRYPQIGRSDEYSPVHGG